MPGTARRPSPGAPASWPSATRLCSRPRARGRNDRARAGGRPAARLLRGGLARPRRGPVHAGLQRDPLLAALPPGGLLGTGLLPLDDWFRIRVVFAGGQAEIY